MDDEYEVPLRDQRYFGAGIKRQRIQFVPPTSSLDKGLPVAPSTSAADRYLAIALSKKPPNETSSANPTAASPGDDPSKTRDVAQTNAVCAVCHRAITATESIAPHESSLAHQVCLPHSHPPSSLDRRRKGLAVLSSQGWDPDSRLGLGATGEGRLQPVKAVKKLDKAGVGARLAPAKAVERPGTLHAGKVREREVEGKRKAEALRNAFYCSEEVERYLGGI